MKTPIIPRKARSLSTMAAAVALGAGVANAADISWSAGTGLFGTGANWTGGNVPGSGDIPLVTNGGSAQVVPSDSFTIQRITLGGQSGTGTLEISGGTLTTNAAGSHNAYIGGSDTNGSTGVGNLIISGGTLAGSGGEFLVGSRGGTGNVTMTGGTLSNDNWMIFGRDGGGTANVTLSGNAQITKTGGGNIALAIFSGTTSTMTMSDTSSMTSNNEIRIGWGNNGSATRGILNMSGSSTASAGGNFQVAMREGGGSGGPTGELHMTGNSTASAGNEFYIGSAEGANGTLTMNDDATITVTNGFVVGRFDSTGTATVNGNAEIAIGGFNVVGDGPPATGTLVMNDNAYVHSARQLWLGLNESDSVVTVNGGLLHASASLDGGAADPTGAGVSFGRFGGTTGSGILNLNGGVLETPGFSRYAGAAQINLDGGTIKATGMTTTGSFFDNIGDDDIDIQAGGAIFDTNGNDITVVQDLAGVGGLTKDGAGTLTLSGTPVYLGDTVVDGGTLSIHTMFLADTSDVWINGTGTLALEFVGSDAVARLFLDGMSMNAGTWGGIGSGAQFESAFLTGTGLLLVTVPEPAEISRAIVAGLGLLALARHRRRLVA